MAVPEASLLHDPGALAALAAPWRALVAALPAPHPFLTHTWFDAWHATFGAGDGPLVVAFHEAGELRGVFPLMRQQTRRGPALSVRFDYASRDRARLVDRPRYRLFPVRQLSPAVNLETANLRGGLLCPPWLEKDYLAALFARLRDEPGWDLGVFPCAGPTAGHWLQAARAAGLNAYLRDSGRVFYWNRPLENWDAYSRRRSHKFRWTTRRADREAAAYRGGLELQTAYGADCGPVLDSFFAVGRRSWKGTDRSGVDFRLPVTDAMVAFNRRLCEAGAAADLRPLLQLLTDRTGTPRAGMLSVHAGCTLVACQTFYDPDAEHVGPGRLLARALFDWGAEHGVTALDWNGFSPFVQYLANDSVAYHQLVVFPTAPYPRMLHALSRHTARDVFEPAQEGVS